MQPTEITPVKKQAADPRWQSRRWQLFYETRAEYIANLYSTIRFAKRMMMFYERMALRVPAVSDGYLPLIKFEREWLQIHQEELRKVVGR